MRTRPRNRFPIALCLIFAGVGSCLAETGVAGRVLDPSGRVVAGAQVRLGPAVPAAETRTDEEGRYDFRGVAPGPHTLTIEAPGFVPATRQAELREGATIQLDLSFERLASQSETVEVTAKIVEPAVDLRNSEVFDRTLFTRDDQVLQTLDAGIDAGQHEGGGKSLEIRRFGFNLDHGGVNGGLKVLVDDIQQNQGTQGHGQGYLGSLKALSPELIESVTIMNGPFSAEYGDFSGLGVVHIHQRESLPERFTIRTEAGNFATGRAFLAYSPDAPKVDAYLAYEGAYTDGPFENPGRYRRDNVNGNYTRTLGAGEKLGFRLLIGRNDFYSSGQIPLDLVSAGLLDRFGYVDPTDGGRVKMGTVSAYYTRPVGDGGTFRADAFVSRSLFDLFSNFTFFLNDPVNGDAIQQHDSRLQEGLNSQYSRPHKLLGLAAMLLAGENYQDAQIDVGLYPRDGRVPIGVSTRADARVTNGAGYVQESVGMWCQKLLVTGGLRFDEFRYGVRDLVTPAASGTEWAGRWQGKGSVALTPSKAVPLTITWNYGRGINSIDARGVVERPTQPRLATTDFYQFGTASNFGRLSLATDVFLIDHSNEMVYIPDDGTFEFKGPSRAYGYEAKLSVAVTRHLSLNGGLTKIGNSFFLGGDHRVYVDSAPHMVANAAVTLGAWHGWSGSLRMRAINHYRLDGDDPGIVASGHTVFDLGIARSIARGVELNLSIDNLTNRDYYETQNWFESQVTPTAPAVWRIHATPGYPLTAVAGVTFRLGAK
jgi:hypothetical protein